MAAKKRTTKKQRDPLAHTLKVLRKNKKATLADCNKAWRSKTKIGGRTLGEARRRLRIKQEGQKVATTNGRRKKTKASTRAKSAATLAALIAKHEAIVTKLREVQDLAAEA